MRGEETALLKQIEVLREKFNNYAYYKDLTADRIVSLGQRMNSLLNRYYKLKNPESIRERKKRPNNDFGVSQKRNLEHVPYETPYPIIVKSGNKEYILVKLFEDIKIENIKW